MNLRRATDAPLTADPKCKSLFAGNRCFAGWHLDLPVQCLNLCFFFFFFSSQFLSFRFFTCKHSYCSLLSSKLQSKRKQQKKKKIYEQEELSTTFFSLPVIYGEKGHRKTEAETAFVIKTSLSNSVSRLRQPDGCFSLKCKTRKSGGGGRRKRKNRTNRKE